MCSKYLLKTDLSFWKPPMQEMRKIIRLNWEETDDETNDDPDDLGLANCA